MGSCIMPGLPTHLVQELYAGTVRIGYLMTTVHNKEKAIKRIILVKRYVKSNNYSL